MGPSTGESPPPAISHSQADNDDGAQVVDDVVSEAEAAAGFDHHPYLFEILKNAGVEIGDELATAIREEVARIKAEGAREAAAAVRKSAGGTTNTNSILRRLIKGAATGAGYVLLHSACACAGIFIFLRIMAHY
ncbi:unnamed protein product [Urochloa decumbens]|uniref:Uncharacterized protein n=1 Tax=Urochloa decumbens TaxID=240449 RepID=A0ABC9FPW2_9POAL